MSKFQRAGFTEQASEFVDVLRVRECPVHFEAKLVSTASFGEKSIKVAVPSVAKKLSIEKVHVCESLLVDANKSATSILISGIRS